MSNLGPIIILLTKFLYKISSNGNGITKMVGVVCPANVV